LGQNPTDYPNAMAYYNEALTIPMFFDLTFDRQDYVIKSLLEIVDA